MSRKPPDRIVVLGLAVLLLAVLVFVWLAVSRPGFFANVAPLF